jgi:hypothetical protein
MDRPLVPILVACLTASACASVEAAAKKVQVPDRFDGSWTITAVTKEGPCAASTNYQVQINNGAAAIPDPDIAIDGEVLDSGGVQATITKGSNKAPISGSLYPGGSGSGAWHTSGGLLTCSGSWSAKRTGQE